jgi:hypothetical protein
MPRGRKLSNQIKSEIITALATRLETSIPDLAKEFGLSPFTFYGLAKKLGIKRPVGKAAPCRKKVARG